MMFGQVMAIYQFDPEPDPHFRFVCEHGVRVLKKLETFGLSRYGAR